MASATNHYCPGCRNKLLSCRSNRQISNIGKLLLDMSNGSCSTPDAVPTGLNPGLGKKTFSRCFSIAASSPVAVDLSESRAPITASGEDTESGGVSV